MFARLLARHSNIASRRAKRPPQLWRNPLGPAVQGIEQGANLDRFGCCQNLTSQCDAFREVGAQDLLLDRQELGGMHLELPQAHAQE